MQCTFGLYNDKTKENKVHNRRNSIDYYNKMM